MKKRFKHFIQRHSVKTLISIGGGLLGALVLVVGALVFTAFSPHTNHTSIVLSPQSIGLGKGVAACFSSAPTVTCDTQGRTVVRIGVSNDATNDAAANAGAAINIYLGHNYTTDNVLVGTSYTFNGDGYHLTGGTTVSALYIGGPGDGTWTLPPFYATGGASYTAIDFSTVYGIIFDEALFTAPNCVPPTGTVQGWLVDKSGNAFNPGATITADTGQASGANPYYLTSVAAGGHTVYSSSPVGYTIWHNLNPDGGGNSVWYQGTSVWVTVPAGAAADLWWMYAAPPPDPSSISAVCNSSTSATISWPAVSGATTYQVSYNGGPSCPLGWTLWTDGATCYKQSTTNASQTIPVTAGQSYSTWVADADYYGGWNWSSQPSTSFTCNTGTGMSGTLTPTPSPQCVVPIGGSLCHVSLAWSTVNAPYLVVQAIGSLSYPTGATLYSNIASGGINGFATVPNGTGFVDLQPGSYTLGISGTTLGAPTWTGLDNKGEYVTCAVGSVWNGSKCAVSTGGSCTTNADCASGNICSNGMCTSTCPDGSAAPSSNSALCTCAQGNTAACAASCTPPVTQTCSADGSSFSTTNSSGNVCGVTTRCPYVGSGYGCIQQSSSIAYCRWPTLPNVTFTARPSLVHNGDTASITWTVSNTQSTDQKVSCSVSDPFGVIDSATGGDGFSHTTTSKPIHSQTSFTLSCTGAVDGAPMRALTAVVNLIPGYTEP